MPDRILDRFAPEARALPDTDWFVPELYDFLAGMDVSVLIAGYSRLVVDLNRPPDNEALYRDSFNTGVCPTTLFSGLPVYGDAATLSDNEIEERVRLFWRPYHEALQNGIDRLKSIHGFCLLYDAHSIRSRVPKLFDGRLPDINIGTYGGRSCEPSLQALVEQHVRMQDGFSWVSNGRFIGGHITRHYGSPEAGVHAVQMEIGQSAYLQERDPPVYESGRSAAMKRCLEGLVKKLLAWRPGEPASIQALWPMSAAP